MIVMLLQLLMILMMMIVHRMRVALDVPSVQLETTTVAGVGGIVRIDH